MTLLACTSTDLHFWQIAWLVMFLLWSIAVWREWR